MKESVDEMKRKLWITSKGCRIMAAILTAVLLVLTALAVTAGGAKSWYLPLALVLSLGAGAYCLLDLKFRWFANLPVILLTPFLAMWLLQWYTCDPMRMYPLMVLLNCIFFYLFYLGLSFLFGSFRLGYGIASCFTLILGVANYFVVEFRSSPIVPWDLLSVGTAASVADNYTYTVTWRLLFLSIGFVYMILTARKLSWYPKKLILRVPAAVVCIGLLLFTGASIQKKSVKDFFGMDQTLFTPNVRYRNNGFVAAFVGNLHLIHIQEPEGYSPERVKEIAEAADAAAEPEDSGASEGESSAAEHAASVLPEGGGDSAAEHAASVLPEGSGDSAAEQADSVLPEGGGDNAAGTQFPNIIVIMNEAFSDLSVLGDFQTNEDYMPVFRSLMENYTSGDLMVSVKGGNTANTEYEFLSGDTMAFLPSGSVVYQQYIKNEVPTLSSWLASLGYSTTAIHPYLGSGWDRDTVYPKLGFQQFLDIDSFADPEYIRNYVSDASAFDKVIETFENGRGQSQFIFEVTMQNHSGYSKDHPGFSERIDLTELPSKTTSVRAAEKYLTLIQESDAAFGELTAYFEQVEEPTVIVMFGDHQPSDYITNVISRITGYDSESSLEEYQRSFLVPYVIWDNFGLEKDDSMELTSVNYLSAYLLDRLGIPMTSYQKYLLELQKELPVICAGTYIDREGVYHSWSEEDETYQTLLNEYNILQYNHLTDSRHRVEEVFAAPAEEQ